ncbi:MAG TPA: aminotransferase class I/II-fold pyridoxal phosphate-dependent enzyme [Anaerovoracaceae bacterium]|nr:aminotransferase class I/II-fold pyridoxal phosphate-dependent enzyme [Anaerovoracaceae bacterium]
MSKAEIGLLKFITCGSVDDGKSTLIGHILYDSKLLYADQMQALILDSQVGSRGGAIDYSLLLDGLMAEREQGITIDVAYRYFTTDARSFIVADTPGHEEYTRNMAVGASFADLAVILMNASRGVLVQTRRHARICALMGIKHFIFAVNKMDLVDYQQARFDTIAAEISTLREELALENVVIIPVSATEGDNVTKPSANMPWYQGKTLLGQLETVDVAGNAPEQGFYMPVQRVCRPDHTFRGFQGQIEAGRIQVGDEITVLPSLVPAVVKNIYITDRAADSAGASQPVTIQLDREMDVSRGCVLVKDAQIKVEKAFSAFLLWMDDSPLITGREYWLKIATKMLTCTVGGVQYKVDVNNGTHIPAQNVSKNEIALCDISLPLPVPCAEFAQHKTLGELILIDRITHATAACGVIQKAGGRTENVCSQGQKTKGMRLNTLLLHGARNLDDPTGSTLPPIYQASAFFHESAEKLEKVFSGKAPGFSYTRISNPTTTAFEKRIAQIEGGVDAVSCASGMAAVAMSLLNILQSGDEIISGCGLFGGTLDLLDDLRSFGIAARFVQNVTAEEVEAAITPKTKVIFAELIGNPRLDVVNIRAVADIAEKHGIPLIIDSTTATPALIRPLEHGAHIVIHSSSKYINGSGNAISGVIVDGGRFKWDFAKFPELAKYKAMGKFAYTARLRQDVWRNFGACLAPQNAYLNCIGLETLGIRMERLCQNALALAEFLSKSPELVSVNYPGMDASPYKPLIDSQMERRMGGAILTVRTGSKEWAFKLIDSLAYARIATNIGDVRTLVIHPASTIYVRSPKEQKKRAGVYDDLIRISVGLEDIEDLKEDFAQAIANMKEGE